MTGVVAAVCRSPTHSLTKPLADGIRLLAGLGVDGDVHQGATVKHLSRILKFGNAPNLRQVHLMHAELFDFQDLRPDSADHLFDRRSRRDQGATA